jgi:S-adenosylmethionine:tRNA ribosyltransferase-isomerase
LQVSDFDYALPEELIAQEPLEERSASRMLVVSRKEQTFRDEYFRHFDRYVRPGDCLVLNDTAVYPARIRGRRNRLDGAQVELLLTRALDTEESTWEALVKPAKRALPGDRILLADDAHAEVLFAGEHGQRTVRFKAKEPVRDMLDRLGETPLPPYIHRPASAADRERYQTVFAAERGSIAAPTAGLHFTPEMLDRCRQAGAEIASVTLHVGLGTFAPLRSEQVTENELHHERYELNPRTASAMRRAKRVVCIGTTSVRAIESAAQQAGPYVPASGETNLFIYPGYSFQATGALLTNFHLPRSSLLMLVAALAGRELILAAYEHAVRERYRFFSYGDCMLIE